MQSSGNYYPQPDDESDGMAAQKPMGGDDEQMEGETALLPKSILAGKEFKPGDEVVLKIVKEHGDQVEVQYATEEPEEDTEAAPSGAEGGEMGGAMNRLSAMGGT